MTLYNFCFNKVTLAAMLRVNYVRKGWRQETLQEAIAVIQTQDDGLGNNGTNGGLVEWSFSGISRFMAGLGAGGERENRVQGDSEVCLENPEE